VSDVGTCGNEKGLGLRHLPNAPLGTASDVLASTAVAVPHGAPGAADVSSGPSPTGTSWSGLRLARQWVKLEPADIDEREEELADRSDEEAGAADLAPPILRGTVTVILCGSCVGSRLGVVTVSDSTFTDLQTGIALSNSGFYSDSNQVDSLTVERSTFTNISSIGIASGVRVGRLEGSP